MAFTWSVKGMLVGKGGVIKWELLWGRKGKGMDGCVLVLK